MTLIKVDSYELEAAQGPFALKVWPPSALEPTLRAFRKRVLIGGFKQNFNGDITVFQKRSRPKGRPKGGGLEQFHESVSQAKNRGKR